ncbi:MAG: hypothetical protein WCX22_05160 [Methanoregula sp.]
MNNLRPVTEEDLLITEVLIAKSYGRLKQSVVSAPARALQSIGQTAREHPYAAAATAVVGGAAVYGIFKMMSSGACVGEAKGGSPVAMQKEPKSQDLLQEMLPLVIPLVAPYIIGYIQKYLGDVLYEDRH